MAKILVAARIEPEQRQALSSFCREEGISFSEGLRRAIDDLLARQRRRVKLEGDLERRFPLAAERSPNPGRFP